MRHKTFTKKEVRNEIKSILKFWKSKKLDGKTFSLRSVIGDYQYDSKLRYIKEVLFYGEHDSFHGKRGAKWYLKYQKSGPKKLAKKVMKAINVT